MVGEYFKVDRQTVKVIAKHRHGVFTVRRLSDGVLFERVGSELKKLTEEERDAIQSVITWSMLTSYVP